MLTFVSFFNFAGVRREMRVCLPEPDQNYIQYDS